MPNTTNTATICNPVKKTENFAPLSKNVTLFHAQEKKRLKIKMMKTEVLVSISWVWFLFLWDRMLYHIGCCKDNNLYFSRDCMTQFGLCMQKKRLKYNTYSVKTLRPHFLKLPVESTHTPYYLHTADFPPQSTKMGYNSTATASVNIYKVPFIPLKSPYIIKTAEICLFEYKT